VLTEHQLTGFIEDTLSADERAQVEAALTQDETTRRRVLEQIRLDAALRATLGGAAASERVKQSVLAVLRGESEAELKEQVLADTTFISRSSRRKEAQTGSERESKSFLTLVATRFLAWLRQPALAISLAAACIAFGLWLALPGGRNAPRLVAEMPSAVTAPASSEWSRGETTLALTAGFVPQSGDELVVAPSASATVRFADGTVVHLEPAARVRFGTMPGTAASGGKQFALLQGTLTADVQKQPSGKPLLIHTPHAVATVLGTEFALAVETNRTELDVARGLVNLASAATTQAVNVVAGESAVASPKSAPRSFTFARNPYLWPFRSDSPWNTPLGAGARYEPIPGRPWLTDGALTNAVRSRKPFLGHPTDPLRNIWINGEHHADVRLAADALPGAHMSDPLVVLQRSRRHALELSGVSVRADGDLDVEDMERTDLAGSGVSEPVGAVNRFGLSNLGGLIRGEEYQRGISHALSARVSRERLAGNMFTRPTTVWPAAGNPPDANVEQGRLHVGSLLAIPPDVDIRSLVGDSGPGYELARAMQDYGVYITGFSDAPFVLLAGEARLNRDKEDAMLSKLVPLLKIVANNTPQTPGGGGTPRREPAPALPSASK